MLDVALEPNAINREPESIADAELLIVLEREVQHRHFTSSHLLLFHALDHLVSLGWQRDDITTVEHYR